MRIRSFLPLVLATAAFAIPPGSLAPNFTGTDSNGHTQTLAQYRGKYVVLEWANKGCPYEQKHYNSGNMEKLQQEWTSKGVVWLSILSSAPGKQGNVSPAEENEYLKTMHAAPTAAILDASGTIGRLYDAKTTPHIFVIDPAGRVIYQGALDDQPTPDPDSLANAHNYLSEALTDAMANKPIPTPVTRPYGCSVKY
jgi:peroxiredoxin